MTALPSCVSDLIQNLKGSGQAPRVLIGLVGPSGSGKSTAADALVDVLGFRRRHIAQCVKRMLMGGFGLTAEQVETVLREKPCAALGGADSRTVMEVAGAAIHSVAPWATSAQFIADLAADGVQFAVVDGMRKVAEAEPVRACGGKLVRIVGPTGWNGDDAKPLDVAQRAVECDDVILNDDSIEVLRKRIVYYAERQLGRV